MSCLAGVSTMVCRVLFVGGMIAIALGSQAFADDPPPGDPLVNPPEFEIINGAATGTLVVDWGPVEVGGEVINTIAYNNVYSPPLIRVARGGSIDLTLTNNLTNQYTNIHFHGMQVSPKGDSDNIFRLTDAGETNRYHVEIPLAHQPGLYWYHSHGYEVSQRQVIGGLSGGIIVEGILDPFPELAGIREQVMLLKNTRTLFGDLPNVSVTDYPSYRMINGQVNPTIDIQPGELQFWRFGNIAANQYFHIKLDGHQFHIIARDGNLGTEVQTVDELFIAPAGRVEVLVRGGDAGTYKLHMFSTTTGPTGDQYEPTTLGTMVVAGEPVEGPPLPANFPPVRDLRDLTITEEREIVFSEDDRYFYVNGAKFDYDVVNTVVPLGAIEVWTISNPTEELHAFHIHQLDYQVIEINGEPVPFYGHQDTVSVPIRGEVKVIIPFDDPVILGKFVYHCHILEHEDGGMMAAIEVVPPEAYDTALFLSDKGGFCNEWSYCVASSE